MAPAGAVREGGDGGIEQVFVLADHGGPSEFGPNAGLIGLGEGGPLQIGFGQGDALGDPGRGGNVVRRVADHGAVEGVVVGHDERAAGHGLQQGGIGAPHGVTMEVEVGVAPQGIQHGLLVDPPHEPDGGVIAKTRLEVAAVRRFVMADHQEGPR